MNKVNRAESERLIREKGMEPELILSPIVIDSQDIASKEQTTGNLLGMVLPMLLIISLLMGTMYPAIDTTAGEKERGTLETLLTLPVTNREIIIGKFFTVAVIGIVSALLNLLSMALMGVYMIKLIGGLGITTEAVKLGKFLPAIAVTILAVLVFSLFISAITMCIAAFAKSYKEANNYITPMTLVVMLTGYIAFIPNIELDRKMALVPVANICLLIKNILNFKYEMEIVALVLLSNIIYAILAVLFLGRVYNSEGILFDEGRSGIQLFEKRSNMKKGGVPTTGDAWFLVCIVFMAVIYIGSLIQLKWGFGGVAGIQLMILLIPLLFVIYTKRSVKETYSFKKPTVTMFFGGVLLVFGTLFLGILLTVFTSMLFPADAETAS
jgi:sodium transport system permease protein